MYKMWENVKLAPEWQRIWNSRRDFPGSAYALKQASAPCKWNAGVLTCLFMRACTRSLLLQQQHFLVVGAYAGWSLAHLKCLPFLEEDQAHSHPGTWEVCSWCWYCSSLSISAPCTELTWCAHSQSWISSWTSLLPHPKCLIMKMRSSDDLKCESAPENLIFIAFLNFIHEKEGRGQSWRESQTA